MAIDHPREQLFDRINRRVDKMIADGLETEAAALYPLRHVNSLNTVGYKEMFAMMDGTMDRDTAIARLAKIHAFMQKAVDMAQTPPGSPLPRPVEAAAATSPFTHHP